MCIRDRRWRRPAGGQVATGWTRSRCSGCSTTRGPSAGGCPAVAVGRAPRGRAGGRAQDRLLLGRGRAHR
eukprot:8034043-Alexandrium_andersonii.AAC.1